MESTSRALEKCHFSSFYVCLYRRTLFSTGRTWRLDVSPVLLPVTYFLVPLPPLTVKVQCSLTGSSVCPCAAGREREAQWRTNVIIAERPSSLSKCDDLSTPLPASLRVGVLAHWALFTQAEKVSLRLFTKFTYTRR